jgi:hypothetical protein
MSGISPGKLGERLQGDENGPLGADIWHVPSSVTVDVYDELTDDPDEANDALSGLPEEQDSAALELGSNNCTAE